MPDPSTPSWVGITAHYVIHVRVEGVSGTGTVTAPAVGPMMPAPANGSISLRTAARGAPKSPAGIL